ncbi:hypothetical protein KFL_006570010 [Klebsormidium nitens]|uniref:DUF7148 domain-containing protein n=1 Tax=Klebsormidium nitens TaxID=105231 RepID=A0A1Y1IP62_KLENI|nr:hypothetical protein KFL_006570010 [Klebsormidium nitens]|eukprot:GAQ90566.1 hypothetical protein KFL_006570010 [Klebsormidium nitens]
MAQTLNRVAFSLSSSPGLTTSEACRSQARSRGATSYSAHSVHSCRCAHAASPTVLFAKKSVARAAFFGTSISGEKVGNVRQAKLQIVRAAAEGATELEKGSEGPPVQLGTAELPEDINLAKLKQLLYQWANSIVTSSALPLPLPLKVDPLDNGVRLAFIRIEAGEISELFRIDVLLTPKSEGERRPMFKVFRDGPYKNQKAAFEPQVMSSLLAALKKSVPLSRGE